MNIFVRTETNVLIPITIMADWKVGDICVELLPEYSNALLSFQGVELRDLDQPLADTGIGSESVLNVRNIIRPILYMNEQMKQQMLLDLENMVLYIIHSSPFTPILKEILTKIGDNQYENIGGISRDVYIIKDDTLTMKHYLNNELMWTDVFITSKDLRLPAWNCPEDKYVELADELTAIGSSYGLTSS